jgi:hypothetical protein
VWRRINAGSEWLAFKLALVFGFVWTVWAFFIIPLVAPLFPASVQAQVFYYGSGWVQLFALPLLTLIGNRTQRLADQSQKEQAELLIETRNIVAENQRLAQIIENLTLALSEHGIDPGDGRTSDHE